MHSFLSYKTANHDDVIVEERIAHGRGHTTGAGILAPARGRAENPVGTLHASLSAALALAIAHIQARSRKWNGGRLRRRAGKLEGRQCIMRCRPLLYGQLKTARTRRAVGKGADIRQGRNRGDPVNPAGGRHETLGACCVTKRRFWSPVAIDSRSGCLSARGRPLASVFLCVQSHLIRSGSAQGSCSCWR